MDHSIYYLQEFKKYISLQTASSNTIKNYLSDLRLFLFFITQNQHLALDSQHIPSYINDDFIVRYEEFLSVTNPPATAKRRISSLKKFIDYCATQGIYPAPLASSVPFSPPPPTTPPPSSVYTPPIQSAPPPAQTPPPVIPGYPGPASYSAPVSAPVQPIPEIITTPYTPPAPVITPPESFTQTAPALPVNPEIPYSPPPTGNILPDPGNLVHNFSDMHPVPVKTAPTPDSKSYLPIIVSIISFFGSFGLTLLVHLLFFK
jgi:hypothetical protein